MGRLIEMDGEDDICTECFTRIPPSGHCPCTWCEDCGEKFRFSFGERLCGCNGCRMPPLTEFDKQYQRARNRGWED